ncbi:MAG TPA: RNA 2',3'-cyclic phosphodiesterase, partial [Erythrobacter sp.]|nr:RNA 2',3'-cyclic phosphodiesterase [Erythrobacter sp.]HCJ45095.1 RNA 2',3'-cyclic phosphodiesterase [Erythrobacter sp.]
PWEVDAYLLYESFLRPEGSVYEPVMRYALELE